LAVSRGLEEVELGNDKVEFVQVIGGGIGLVIKNWALSILLGRSKVVRGLRVEDGELELELVNFGVELEFID
jgi:hypothetical protein